MVVATGDWLPRLAHRFGVRRPVQAGRGYSFSVPASRVPAGPIYLPEQRIACTPLGEVLRIAGTMEFRRPDAPLDPRRIRAIVEAVRPFLCGVDLDHRRDEWVGSRPCTNDGLPLVGPTASPRVFAAGGHGMWASCWARSPAGCWPRRSSPDGYRPRWPRWTRCGEPAAEPVTHAVTRVPAVEDIGGTAASPGGRAVEKVRDGHQIRNRAEHLAVGVDLDGSSTYSASAPSFRGGEVLGRGAPTCAYPGRSSASRARRAHRLLRL